MKLLFPALIVFPFALAHGQQTFPTISGETSDGGTLALPAASAGHVALIAVAFSRKAEPMLLEWYEPAYLRFVAKHDLMASDVDADLWLVPVFTGLNKVGYGPSLKKLREEGDPDAARRVLFVKEDASAFLDALGVKDRDIPYFFALDASGHILHREQGSFTDDKLDALAGALEN